MEIALQELIDKIKSDGVGAGEKEAAARIEDANASAEKIIADAKAEEARLMAEARDENDRLVRASEDAIRQAGRNQLISFRDSVTKELDAVIGEAVAESYSRETLLTLIPKVVEEWAKNPDTDDIEVLLGSEDLSAIEGSLTAALKQRLCAGVTLRADDSVDSGFRIAAKGGSAYYDYSAEAVAELLSRYLNPRVAALMKEASKA
ncbi:MAG: hypothetical protein LIO39_01455 [Lachnospiraceae bacterium]|nr:hypothetical protein [Lachnospiraceae bacterium]